VLRFGRRGRPGGSRFTKRQACGEGKRHKDEQENQSFHEVATINIWLFFSTPAPG